MAQKDKVHVFEFEMTAQPPREMFLHPDAVDQIARILPAVFRQAFFESLSIVEIEPGLEVLMLSTKQ